MDKKRCSQCYQELPISSYYVDKTTSTGYTSACKKCRNKQNVAARRRREKLRKGLFAEAPNQDLFNHNYEALEYLAKNNGFKTGASYRAKVKGAIKEFEAGVRIGEKLIHIETIRGPKAIDLRRASIEVLARFLENHNIKLLIDLETNKKLLKSNRKRAERQEEENAQK